METREPFYPAGGNVVGTANIENSMHVPQKTKNKMTI